jgi:uncharacterized membrane protein YphA (DoxX/SURF4 family)
MLTTLTGDRKAVIHKWLVIALRLTFGIILIAASIDKIQHPWEFVQSVENYGILGERFARWVAIWLPYLELIVGILLILGIWLDAASILTFLMMIIFAVAVTQAYFRGLDINCGCFSTEGGAKIDLLKLFYNFTLLIGSFILMQASFKKQSIYAD